MESGARDGPAPRHRGPAAPVPAPAWLPQATTRLPALHPPAPPAPGSGTFGLTRGPPPAAGPEPGRARHGRGALLGFADAEGREQGGPGTGQGPDMAAGLALERRDAAPSSLCFRRLEAASGSRDGVPMTTAVGPVR